MLIRSMEAVLFGVVGLQVSNYLAVCSRTWAEIHSMAGSSATVSGLFTFSWRLDRRTRETRPRRSSETVPATSRPSRVMSWRWPGTVSSTLQQGRGSGSTASRKWPLAVVATEQDEQATPPPCSSNFMMSKSDMLQALGLLFCEGDSGL